MYLSQLLVNPGSDPDRPRLGAEWLKQTYRVHQRIWMAFPSGASLQADPFFLGRWPGPPLPRAPRGEAGFLFRIEPEAPLRILVQSSLRPNWDYAFQNARQLLADQPQVRLFNPVLEPGCAYRFRLIMQMVSRRTIPPPPPGATPSKRRTEHPIRCLIPSSVPGVPPQPDLGYNAWRARLSAIAPKAGFEVDTGTADLSVRPADHLFMKPEAGLPARRFNAALFDGTLRCTDPGLLCRSVMNGVGRGKAFGMGLLSLATVG